MGQFKDLKELIEYIQSLDTLDQKKKRLTYLKREILKLEITVILVGLLGLSLIVLPLLGIIKFSWLIGLAILLSALLIFKAFKDGELLEIEKFFLLIFMSNSEDKDAP